MYMEKQRSELLEHITLFLRESPVVEGLLLIGSGAEGFADIYSDIDLMAGCYDEAAVETADRQLQQFFMELGACHLERRAWSRTALGMSAYFENGLSLDLSYLPTKELPLRSPQYQVLFAKSEGFVKAVESEARKLAERQGRYGLDDGIHYRFIQQLRYAEIALHRGELIFAERSMSEARQLLLLVETVLEEKKLHQFKAYNSLDEDFLHRLEKTYAPPTDREKMWEAKENLLTLYLDTVSRCEFLCMDNSLLKLLGSFK